MKKVVIIQKALPHYRVDFYNKLKQKLAENEIELSLLYGKRNTRDALKKDEAEIEWATYVPNTIFKIKNVELYWQSCLPYLGDKDLVIAEQANKLLLNYYLLLKRLVSRQKFAYWGHGKNMQDKEGSFRNKIKKNFINQCDWWFAYTSKVKDYLVANSFPADKITCVQNAIDTQALSRSYDAISEEEAGALKTHLGIESDHVAIYCGGMYKEKRIDFLVEACDQIRSRIPDFHIIFIGSGLDAHIIKAAAETRPWLHYLGPQLGLSRVKYFRISSLFLMPGLVGLAVLDAFALRTPMITTDYPYHSPEIEYLVPGVNGVITENTLENYVDSVVKLFNNEGARQKLVDGCIASSTTYTVDKMVDNYAAGVIKCLNYN